MKTKGGCGSIGRLGSGLMLVVLAVAASASAACVNPPAGLVSWWRGEGDATDFTSTNNGTLAQATGYAAGRVGQAFSFGGSGSGVDLGMPADLEIQDFTIEAWVKRGSSVKAGWDVYDHGMFVSWAWGGYGFGMFDSGQLFLTKVGYSSVSPTLAITDTNHFHHVAVTKAGSNVVFYLDGVAQSVSGYDPGFVFNGTMAIGTRGSDHVVSFNGDVDEASVYSRALTAGEIEGIYGAGEAGKCLPPAPGCVPSPTHLVSWWQAEANTSDETGHNNGSIVNGASFAPGIVGQAFSFTGTNQIIRVPDSPSLNPTNALTVEGWVYVTAYPLTDASIIFGKDDSWADRQYELDVYNSGGHLVFLGGLGTPGSFVNLMGTQVVSLNTWTHFAITYDGSSFSLYVDGALDQSIPFSGPLTTGNVPFTIGGLGYGPWSFFGSVDELSLYDRALSSSEIHSIYSAGSAGKCTTPAAPSIYLQPTNQTVVAAQSAIFTVVASGAAPLSYQWMFNGAAIEGATNATLLLLNVQEDQGGDYAVEITNSSGSIVSSNAVLTVSPAPPCTPTPAGLVSWWRAEGDALDTAGGNTGALVNGASFAPGEDGQAFAFAGSNQVVVVSNSPSLNPTSQVSLDAWIRLSAYPNSDGIVVVAKEDPYDWGTLQYYLGLRLVQGQWVFEPMVGVPSGLQYVHGSTPVLLNTWYHAALTYDGTSLKLYVNGNLDGSIPVSGPLTTGTIPLTIGGFQSGPWNVNGLVDEVSLYNRALTAPEVQAIYTSGSAGKCSTPSAPDIYLQPASQALYVLQTASFTVGASGTQPLSYQWMFNGRPIDGATQVMLVLTNVQESQAGTYAVQITNLLGSVLSSNATLTVNPAPDCVQPPAGLLSWWEGEGNTSDRGGLNNASIVNGVTFAPGMVGQAFAFDGQGSYVEVADNPSLDPTNGLTVELWYKDTGSQAGARFYGLMAKRAPYPAGANFGLSFYLGSPAYLQAYLQDPNYYGYQNTTCAVPAAGVFHHVAATYAQQTPEQVEVRLYVDGQLASSNVLSANMARTLNNAPVTIGADNRFEDYFVGLIDEPTIYRRALSASEIQAIFNAGVSGKCQSAVPVSIYSQPSDQVVTAGQMASFIVGASGTGPLSYQWNLNGVPIPGATEDFLALTNVQTSQAGAYSVLVTNAAGSVLSSNAVLTVNFPPANVRLASATVNLDGSVTIPVLLAANGNENALGFSIDFAPALLSFAGVATGSDATTATIFVNTNQVADGRFGLIISLPAGSTFAAGTQEIARVSFVSGMLTNPASAELTFGDQPTIRQLSDAQANSLAATFTGTTIDIPAVGFEGDVSPRPAGDQALTVTDWVLVGRYAARLDYPTNASEYQRADCAPASTSGDGAITVADWVQAGRYAAGIDPAVRAGGPTNDVSPGMVNSKGTDKVLPPPVGPQPKSVNPRQVKVAATQLAPGMAGSASVLLESQGDENAAGFTLAFDPAVLTFAGASVGDDANGATLDINASQAASGKLAFVLAMPTGGKFAAGTRELVKVGFTPVASTASSSPLSLTDNLAIRQVVDASANELTADFVNGSVVVNPTPVLSIARDGQNVTLTWPMWATNFTLQEADAPLTSTVSFTNSTVAPVLSGGQATVTVPAANTTRLYRLKGK